MRAPCDKDKYKSNTGQIDRRWFSYHLVVGEPPKEQLVELLDNIGTE